MSHRTTKRHNPRRARDPIEAPAQDHRGPRWARRLRGLRSPVRAELYVPRRSPHGSPHPGRPGLDRFGTPVPRDVSTLDDGVRTLRRAAKAARRGPTRRERLAAFREVFPGATRGQLRRAPQFHREAADRG